MLSGAFSLTCDPYYARSSVAISSQSERTQAATDVMALKAWLIACGGGLVNAASIALIASMNPSSVVSSSASIAGAIRFSLANAMAT